MRGNGGIRLSLISRSWDVRERNDADTRIFRAEGLERLCTPNDEELANPHERAPPQKSKVSVWKTFQTWSPKGWNVFYKIIYECGSFQTVK